jgi:hypothetical protein
LLQEAQISQRFINPRPDFWSSTAPYSGGVLRFYATGTSTPLSYYTNAALTTGAATSHTLNSAGRPTTDIWLQNVDYKITLEDSAGSVIWTADPVRGSDFAKIPLWTSYSGNPNGFVAGTAGSSGVMPSVVWDYTNAVLYVCTTSGVAASAVWTAVNEEEITLAVTPPQGRLTTFTGLPVLVSDVTAATAVYYTPHVGNQVPIYDGTSMVPTTFSELTLTLVASHLANAIYDVFVFDNNGVPTLVTGPAWATATIGAGDRGTGAGTTQLARVGGLWTNGVSMTGRNSSTTYAISANYATYLGTIAMDGTNGQVSCHVSWGASRKWGVWNAYNRIPILLKAGDSTASWTYATNTVQASRAQSTNSLTTLSGLPLETIQVRFMQNVQPGCNAGGTSSIQIGIGYNVSTVFNGTYGKASQSLTGGTALVSIHSAVAETSLTANVIGINTFYACENVPTSSASQTFFGGEDDMLLTARWNG